MRAPKDAEILIALVAGQIVATAGSANIDAIKSSVGLAEMVVAEVLARGDARDEAGE